jgi:hypothetical protein
MAIAIQEDMLVELATSTLPRRHRHVLWNYKNIREIEQMNEVNMAEVRGKKNINSL